MNQQARFSLDQYGAPPSLKEEELAKALRTNGIPNYDKNKAKSTCVKVEYLTMSRIRPLPLTLKWNT